MQNSPKKLVSVYFQTTGIKKSKKRIIKKTDFAEGDHDMIPQDPIILLSFINTNLRDKYHGLEALGEGLDISKDELDDIIKKLGDAGYSYDAAQNQFV